MNKNSLIVHVLIFISSLISFKMTSKAPKVLVFDLDYTLWPFWVDTHVNPPLTKSNGVVKDSLGQTVKCYPEVPLVLKNLHERGYTLAVASRTGEIQGAQDLMQLFDWDQYFTYKQIFPGSKVTHLTNISKQSGQPFSEIIFFDDENRNIHDVSKLGVLSILVRNGVTRQVVADALEQFSNQQSDS